MVPPWPSLSAIHFLTPAAVSAWMMCWHSNLCAEAALGAGARERGAGAAHARLLSSCRTQVAFSIPETVRTLAI
jgi:hypothetical protein